MSDTLKQKPGTPRVALPKIPPWKPSTPTDQSKTVGQPQQQAPRNDAKARQSLDLTPYVGSRVQIINLLSKSFVGTIYSCDTDLVLSTGPFDYHIIPVSKIVKCEVLSRDESPSKRTSNDVAEREKEKDRQAKLREERLARPSGVSNFGYKLFLALEKTLPVAWHEKSIIVMDNVLIEPPYSVNDCKAPEKYAKQLERVKELVKNEQEKSQKDNTLGRRGG